MLQISGVISMRRLRMMMKLRLMRVLMMILLSSPQPHQLSENSSRDVMENAFKSFACQSVISRCMKTAAKNARESVVSRDSPILSHCCVSINENMYLFCFFQTWNKILSFCVTDWINRFNKFINPFDQWLLHGILIGKIINFWIKNDSNKNFIGRNCLSSSKSRRQHLSAFLNSNHKPLSTALSVRVSLRAASLADF